MRNAGITPITFTPDFKTVPVVLQKGQQYYLEILQKAGVGPDRLGLGWTWTNAVGSAASATNDVPSSTVHLLPHVPPGTPPTITLQLADVTTSEGVPVKMFLNVQGSPPLNFQWYRNGTAVTDGSGNLGYVDFPNPFLSDNSSKWKVRVTNPFGTVESEEHELTISGDTVAPSLLDVQTRGNPNAVEVQYSDSVTDATATNRANCSLDGGIVITNILKLDCNTVRLLTTTMSENRAYTLTVSGIKDTHPAGNIIAAGTQWRFVLGSGSLTREFYENIPGVTVGDLTNHATFLAHAPSAIDFPSAAGIPANHADNYGTRLVGYVIPPVTGLYSFFIASRDASSLYLSTNENPANQVLIAAEPLGADRYQWNGPASGGGRVQRANGRWSNQSDDIPLVTGRKYYIEALHKAGMGNDWMDVTWKISNIWEVFNNDVTQLNEPYLTAYATLGVVVITNQPASQSVCSGGSAVLSVGWDGTPPYTIQWQRNVDNSGIWTNLFGQTNRMLVIQPATSADAGQYRAVVTNWFSSAISAAEVLAWEECLQYARSGDAITLTWDASRGGRLQTASAVSVTNTWADIPGATNGTFQATPSTSSAFFRVRYDR